MEATAANSRAEWLSDSIPIMKNVAITSAITSAIASGLVWLPVCLLLATACVPMGETPGIRLGGSDAGVPASFAFVQDSELIQLEAKGALFPRVVNIWAVGFDDALYVWSDPGTGWSQRVDQRPDEVRVRVGDNVYQVSATRVHDSSVKKRVAQAFQTKYADDINELYGQPVTADDFEVLYRLTPRTR